MKDHPSENEGKHNHNHPHHEKTGDVVETFKEEGMLTVEALDIASHDAVTHAHKSHTSRRPTLTTPVAVLIGSCIIALGIIAYGLITRTGTASAPSTVFAGRSIDATDFIDGKIKSDVVVVEYSDPECPFCVQLHPTIQQLRTEYGDKIAFVYRHFPLTQIHPNAFDESKAILCAGTVGGNTKFYEYVDALFGYKITNKTTQLPLTGKEDIAKNIGLDISEFTKCMADKSTSDAINASLADGAKAGVQGTPSTFVLKKTRKGYDVVSVVDGARPYSFLKAVVDEALSR